MPKKIKIIFAAAVLAAFTLAFSGCQSMSHEDETSAQTEETETSVVTGESITAETPAPTEEELHAAALSEKLRANMPKIDGSTSAIPLDAAIRAGIFGITREEAEREIVHTSSYESLYNLIHNDVEFVFCHLLHERQYDDAKAFGMELEQTPIAREGFVFLVSRDNPVDSLTVQQIKDIYSGKITNWKEVGGEDLPIEAFQRNEDSGSQNYMTEFMGDTPLTDAPTVVRPGNMDSLVNAVASYDGSTAGIGYSVYSYVGGMYDADGGVKLLKVDGVAPDFSTIADGTYPCTGYNYIVFSADEPEDSPCRMLLEWILTDAGQRAIAETGYYAPLAPMSGIDVTIKSLDLYVEKGTGKADFTPCAWYYTSPVQVAELTDKYAGVFERGDYTFAMENNRPVTGNDALDSEIEGFLLDTVDAILTKADNGELGLYTTQQGMNNIQIQFSLINGYISAEIRAAGSYYAGAVWDIESGKRLTLSDLFVKDADFIGQLNAIVRKRIDYAGGMFYEDIELKRPFEGIESGFDNFSLIESYGADFDESNMHLNLYFNQNENSYFILPAYITCELRALDNCLVREARETASDGQKRVYFAHENDIRRVEVIENADKDDPTKKYWSGEYRWRDIVGYAGAEKINAAIYAHLKNDYDYADYTWSEEAVEKALAEYGEYISQSYGLNREATSDDLNHCRLIIESELCYFGDKYVVASNYARSQYDDGIGFGGGVYGGEKSFVYDLETGDEVEIDALFDGEPDGDWYKYAFGGSVPCERPENVTLARIVPNSHIWVTNSDGGHEAVFCDIILTYNSGDGGIFMLDAAKDSIMWFD